MQTSHGIGNTTHRLADSGALESNEMFEFPSDTSRPDEEIEVNRLDNQSLVRYYEAEWRRVEQ